MNDPSSHWITQFWDSVDRAPGCDIFHLQKHVTESTRGTGSELHIPFASTISNACLKYDRASQNHIFSLYDKEENKGKLVKEVAIVQMMANKKYKRKVKSFAASRNEMKASISDAFNKTQTKDLQLKEEALLRKDGYRSYLLKPVRGHCCGTEKEIQNMFEHIKKGCVEFPLSVDEMNVAIDPADPYSDQLRMQGTSTAESFNKQLNRLVKFIGRQSAEQADIMRMWLRVGRYNLQKDAKLAKVLEIKEPRSFEWFLHELLLGRIPNLLAYRDIKFPPELPDGYDEPIGVEFARYKEWDKVQSDIDMIQQFPQEQRRIAPATITTDFSPAVASVV